MPFIKFTPDNRQSLDAAMRRPNPDRKEKIYFDLGLLGLSFLAGFAMYKTAPHTIDTRPGAE